MEQVIALTAIAFLSNKIIELLKYLRTKDWNAAFTLAAVEVSGVVVMLLAAGAKVTETLVLPGTSEPIGSLDKASVVLLGLVMTSLSSTIYDFKKAFDSTDSAKQPPLLGPG